MNARLQRYLLAITTMLVMAFTCGCGSRDAGRAIDKGIGWLLTQQAKDGGWHSTTYGQMRGGAANTALIVYAFAALPDDARQRAQPAIDRALQFLLSNLNEQGFVQNRDGSSDYPTYATAMLLTAMSRMKVTDWADERERMRKYLVASQQTERHGLSPAHLDYGGWHQTGGDPREPVQRYRTNVSVTSYALEALRASGGVDDGVRDPALAFLKRCQNFPPAVKPLARRGDRAREIIDGGFFFTPRESDMLNKAGAVEIGTELWQARSYGTATADGLAALIACGLNANDARIKAATDWLARHDDLRHVPGFPGILETDVATRGDADESMRDGLRFYYLAALSRVASRSNEIAARKTLLAAEVIAAQRADGSWRNESNAMREDDPQIATAFALTTLGAIVER